MAQPNPYSLAGWNISAFLKGNKEFLKIVATLLVALVAYFQTASYAWSGLALIIVKALADIVDYWQTN